MKHDRRNIMAMVCRCLVERGLLWCCLFEHNGLLSFCCFLAVTICLLCCYISIFYLYAGMVLWFLLYLRHHPYVKVKNCDGTAPFVLRFHVFTHTITTMVLIPCVPPIRHGFISIPMILFCIGMVQCFLCSPTFSTIPMCRSNHCDGTLFIGFTLPPHTVRFLGPSSSSMVSSHGATS